MPALGEYPNVWDSAIAVLEEKGFDVWRDEAAEVFWAQRGGWDFLADSPIALLGLVAIYEQREPGSYTEYWWKAQPRHDSLDLPTAPPDYTPVWRR